METQNQVAFTLKAQVHEREIASTTIGFSMFNQFNAEVADFLAGSQRRAALEEVRFTIQDGSYKLNLIPPALLAVVLHSDLIKLRQKDSLADIDPKRADIIKRWQNRALTTPGYEVVIDSPEKSFETIRISDASEYRVLDDDYWVAVEKYFIGTVVDMGGTTAANVHFRIEDTDRQLVAESNES
jgi:hypothetical protein